jgi:class III poly(R)-hydroxyalkanoic acid synthase PhaE subunit
MATSASDTGDLFKSFLGEWGPLLKPWLGAVNEAAMSGHFGGMLMGGSEGLSRLLSIGQDLEPAFEGFAEIPSIGVSREQQAKILRAFDAWVDFRKVNLKYQAALAKILGQAVERMTEELAKLAKSGKKIDSVRDVMKLWVRTADQAFTEVYATEEYHALQRELSSAGMDYKIKQQEVLNMIFKMLNLPSRAELDDAYLTLYQLKKEVKALKKELKTSQSVAALEEPKAEAKRKVTAAAKPKTASA